MRDEVQTKTFGCFFVRLAGHAACLRRGPVGVRLVAALALVATFEPLAGLALHLPATAAFDPAVLRDRGPSPLYLATLHTKQYIIMTLFIDYLVASYSRFRITQCFICKVSILRYFDCAGLSDERGAPLLLFVAQEAALAAAGLPVGALHELCRVVLPTAAGELEGGAGHEGLLTFLVSMQAAVGAQAQERIATALGVGPLPAAHAEPWISAASCEGPLELEHEPALTASPPELELREPESKRQCVARDTSALNLSLERPGADEQLVDGDGEPPRQRTGMRGGQVSEDSSFAAALREQGEEEAAHARRAHDGRGGVGMEHAGRDEGD